MSPAYAIKHRFPEREVQAAAVNGPMKRLTERTNTSPHLDDILQGMLALCATGLELRISETLSEFEKQMVRLADKAAIHQQNQYFDSVHMLKRDRADVAPRFLRNLENSLAHLGENTTQADVCDDVPDKSRLALTDGTQLDESLVLEDIATKVELRVREPLYTLGHRFGALAGTPRIPADILPLGPRCIVEALRYGVAKPDLPLEHRLVLYRCFERVAMNEIGTFYAALNNFLIEKSILPDLHVLSTSALHARATVVAPRPERAAHNRALAAPPREPESASVSRIQAMSTSPQQRSSDGFGALKLLLAECRRAEAYTASGADLQGVLASLQVRHAGASSQEANTLYSGEQIKQEVLQALQERSMDGRAPRIDDDHADAIDLVAMLCEFLSRRARAAGLANWILAKLQVPVVRAALADKRFFSDRVHPARQLLNDLVEAARFWVDEAEAENDPALVDKLKLITNQVVVEYQGNVLVFTAALQVLLRHVDALLHKVEVAERRHVEAASGREKLQYARMLASAAIGDRIAAIKPSEFLRTLLQRAWVDVLAVSLLREGEGSASHARRVAVVDQLLALGAGSEPATNGLTLAELRAEIEMGLTQVGLHSDDVRALTQKLLAISEHEQGADPISLTELAIKLQGKARFGGDLNAGSMEDKPPFLSADEDAVLQRLKMLPVGTWFEFNVNAADDTQRRKLSWYSTRTGRCLLVGQRGMPIDYSLALLARDTFAGRVRIVTAEQEPLIDRALLDIGDTLKSFSTPRQGNSHDVPPVQDRIGPVSSVRAHTAGLQQREELRTLLLVDDEENILRALNRVLRGEGYRILTATNARDAMAILGQNEVQVIVSDQRMPEVSGTEFMSSVKSTYPSTVRMVLSGYSDVSAVTEAINRGAIYKFLTKPWEDDDIRLHVREAFRAATMLSEAAPVC